MQLQDTNLRVNVGNHLATEKADFSGNIRVREMANLPDTSPANNQLMFRSMFIDNSGRFYRGPERHLPDLPVHPVPPVVTTGGGGGGGLWQPSGTGKMTTDRWVGIQTTDPPKVSLEINGHMHLRNGNSAAVFSFPATGAQPNLFIRSDDDPFTYEQSTERMFIGSNGRVGIMNTNPQFTLDVSGVIHASDSIKIGNSVVIGGVNQNTGTDNRIYSIGGDLNIQGNTTYNTIFSNIQESFVGIGATIPRRKLHIVSISSHTFKKAGIRLTDVFTPTGSIKIWDLYPDGETGNLYIGTTPSAVGAATTPKMTITEQGWAGLGTTNPFSKLHIENNGNVRITLRDASYSKFFQIEQDQDLVSFNDGGVKQIINMSLTSGNVGIGTTTSPSEKLHIKNGSIYVDGEGQGVIVNAGGSKSAGFMKYAGREAGIWRTKTATHTFDIGRVDALNTGANPIVDFTIDASGYVGIGLTTLFPKARLDIGDDSPNLLKSVLARLREGNSTGEGTYLGIKSYNTQLLPQEYHCIQDFISQNGFGLHH